jgi:probable rRNA maturation factor
LRRLLLSALAGERAPTGTLHVQLVSDDVMRRVNADFRGKDETTDVLSFAYWNEPHAGELLGEVLVSPVVARRQAREEGRPLDEEIARLALHGLLHVLGYDHETARERKHMLSLQEEYIAKHWAAASPRRASPRGSLVRC